MPSLLRDSRRASSRLAQLMICADRLNSGNGGISYTLLHSVLPGVPACRSKPQPLYNCSPTPQECQVRANKSLGQQPACNLKVGWAPAFSTLCSNHLRRALVPGEADAILHTTVADEGWRGAHCREVVTAVNLCTSRHKMHQLERCAGQIVDDALSLLLPGRPSYGTPALTDSGSWSESRGNNCLACFL